MSTVTVRHADRMMISTDIGVDGISVTYADGASGVVPYSAIEGVKGREFITGIELPNPYEIVLILTDGSREELPWDFVRWHCDESYGARTQATMQKGRQAIGERIRRYRKSSGLTQAALANQARVGRVTVARIENASHAPTLETLSALAGALGIDVAAILADE